jgi:hypothetical protein
MNDTIEVGDLVEFAEDRRRILFNQYLIVEAVTGTDALCSWPGQEKTDGSKWFWPTLRREFPLDKLKLVAKPDNENWNRISPKTHASGAGSSRAGV